MSYWVADCWDILRRKSEDKYDQLIKSEIDIVDLRYFTDNSRDMDWMSKEEQCRIMYWHHKRRKDLDINKITFRRKK